MSRPETGNITVDIAARERHVVGSGPRIAPIPNDEVDPECRSIANGVRAGAGVGPIEVLAESMRIMMKHPPLFRCQMDTGLAIFRGQISKRDRELAVLRVGWLSRAPYEWGEHVDIARRYGVTQEEIERVTHGSSAAGWSERDKAIIRGVEELVADQVLSEDTWSVLSRTWSEPQMIEYLVVVGQYLAIALLQNSIRVPLASDNPGLAHR